MRRNKDEKSDNGKKAEGGRNELALETGDAVSEKKNPPISGDISSGSNPDISPGGGAPLQDAKDSPSGSIQQLNPDPRTELARGPNVSDPKRNLNLDLKSIHQRLPVPLLEGGSNPPVALEQPRVVPLNIPLVAVDGSRCRFQSTSSEESLKGHLSEVKKLDNLEVNVSPGKRKMRTSPIGYKYLSDNSSSSQSSADRKDYPEQQRQKKSLTSRLFKSPTRSKEKSPKDLTAKRDKSPSYSQAKRDKSPSYSQAKRDKSPSYSQAKRDKSPSYSQAKREKSPKGSSARARSPSKFGEILKHTKGFFSKRDESNDESKPLCEIEEGSPKKVVKESKLSLLRLKGIKIPDDVYLDKDIHSSETTCDSPSTRFSMASISTDSPISEAGNAIGTNTPEAPESPHQESPNQESPNQEAPNPKDEDCEMDENN